MNNNITMIIIIVSYGLGTITKLFINSIPSKFIPLQNFIIGLVSAIICYFAKLAPNFLDALFTCLMATMSAGGIYDLINKLKNSSEENIDSDVG